MSKLNVALLANLKKNAPHVQGQALDQWADLDSEATVQALQEAIRAGGHACTFLEGDLRLVDSLRALKPDICFNICEGHFGDARESQVPALLEMLRLPYTGSRVLPLALCLDKPMTKRVLMWHDLPTPAFQIFERADEPLDDDMVFPLFVKPSREGTGMGVSAESVVRNEAELRERLKVTLDRYRQTALVEHFIDGREVTVGLVGNCVGPRARRLPGNFYGRAIEPGLRLFPALEINLEPYQTTDVVYSNRLKTDLADADYTVCPAPLDEALAEELQYLTAAAFRVTGCQDVARVDFRLSADEGWKPYILEINPLPGLSPGISDLVLEAEAAGVDYVGLVNLILDQALARYGLRPRVTVSLPI